MFNRFKNITPFIALAIGLMIAQPTLASTINFNTLVVGANVNSDPNALSLGITFDNGAILPTLDSTGTPIAGTDHWQIDITVPLVTVSNGTSLGGHAYATANGLDAIQQAVLMHLGGIFDVSSFSVNASSFDGQSFGGLYNPTLDFLDINGNSVASVAYNLVGSVFSASLSTQLHGVTDVVLAGGALYNNISFNVTAVPVPGAIWLFGSALMGFMGVSRRNKKA
jgi:hypothetical protein